MAKFNKSDLAYTGYKETAYPSDDPRITGKPDSTLLNRSEAWEMVYFINNYMESKNWLQKATFNKIEAFLKKSSYQIKNHKFWREGLAKNFR